MNNGYLIYAAVLITSFLIPLTVGTLRFRQLDKPARIFLGLVLFAFVSELVAIYQAVSSPGNVQDNIKVYNVAGILYTFWVCIYFNSLTRNFFRYEIGLYAGICSVILGIVNSLIFQPFASPNTYFRIYQCLLIICMGLTSLGLIVIRPGYVNIRRQPHFWLFSALIFFWSFIYLHLLLYDRFIVIFPRHKWLIAYSILLANITYNLFIGLIFILYPKMSRLYATG